jgi:Contractile injection system tube protein
MKQRVLRMLPVLFVCSIAAVVLADKKTASVVIKLVRLEGKGAADEVVFNPEEFSIDKSVTWKKGSDSSNDSVEFVASEPEELSCELMFDGFETKENVYTKNIQPIESLIAVDQGLKRPPMVSVTMFGATLPQFRGVISSLNTKYTMFLADGTPVRATVNVKLKKASSASVGKNPCP